MKPTDFSKALSHFLSVYLPSQRNLSKNTIASYCDTFKLLFGFLSKEKHIAIENIQIKDISSQTIDSFLEWLDKNRNCSRSTVNQRLACVHSFFRYLQASHPGLILNCQQILSIPFRKREIPCVNYLFSDDLKLILEQPNTRTARGRRDLVLLSLMYDTGALPPSPDPR